MAAVGLKLDGVLNAFVAGKLDDEWLDAGFDQTVTMRTKLDGLVTWISTTDGQALASHESFRPIECVLVGIGKCVLGTTDGIDGDEENCRMLFDGILEWIADDAVAKLAPGPSSSCRCDAQKCCQPVPV